MIIIAQIFTYIPNFLWMGLYITCFVLAILFYTRTRRKPFLALTCAFALAAVYNVYYVLMNGTYLSSDLIAAGMSISEASIMVLYLIVIPNWVVNGLSAVMLLGATIMFYKEGKK
jgi:hypothetical protein